MDMYGNQMRVWGHLRAEGCLLHNAYRDTHTQSPRLAAQLQLTTSALPAQQHGQDRASAAPDKDEQPARLSLPRAGSCVHAFQFQSHTRASHRFLSTHARMATVTRYKAAHTKKRNAARPKHRCNPRPSTVPAPAHRNPGLAGIQLPFHPASSI